MGGPRGTQAGAAAGSPSVHAVLDPPPATLLLASLTAHPEGDGKVDGGHQGSERLRVSGSPLQGLVSAHESMLMTVSRCCVGGRGFRARAGVQGGVGTGQAEGSLCKGPAGCGAWFCLQNGRRVWGAGAVRSAGSTVTGGGLGLQSEGLASCSGTGGWVPYATLRHATAQPGMQHNT